MSTQTLKTHYAYLSYYPRDFANEYEVFAGAPPEIAKLEEILGRNEKGSCRRIDRDEALRLGWKRPIEARQDGEQWFGGFAQPEGPAPYPETPRQSICNAHQATLETIAKNGEG